MKPVNNQTVPERTCGQVNDEPYSLRREIGRGWAWVTFVWHMLTRLGGLRATIRSLVFLVTLLIKRTLVTWGWIANR
ncbi:MAG: hypothetical protein KME03_15885 [Aphanocapsa lilacina HA4352-LM1]|jgi:hypothetical protein|nr:hypothetical protein [Aphanocapsa lilacina HA4352-LM1]